jgi:hypothetical protein
MKILENTKFVFKEYCLSASLALLIVITKYLPFNLLTNETVYLVGPKQILDPGFLQHDWTVGSQSPYEKFTVVYDLLIAPLYIIGDPLEVALIGRLLVWTLLIVSLILLTKSLKIKWWQFAIGFYCLIYWEWGWRILIAGNWIFGGVESKCFSYAFLIMALSFVIKKRCLLGGIFTGIAISFHVIVGGWGFVALLGALIINYKDYGYQNILKFTLCSILLGSPVFIKALAYLKIEGTAISTVRKEDIDKLQVLFRNPHHLDPKYFLTWKKSLLITAISCLTTIMLFRNFNKQKAVFIVSFLGILLSIFFTGIIAWEMNFFWFLKFYPFRLFPVFLLLFFCFNFPVYLFPSITSDNNELRISFNKKVSSLAVLLILSFKISLSPLYSDIKSFPQRWKDNIINYEKKSLLNQAENWIKQHTDRDSIFIAQPYDSSFWLFAERAMVVNFKAAPTNARFLEWYERIKSLNGDNEFKGVGFQVYSELRQNYPELSLNQLRKIKQKYRAEYYLVEKERKDLKEMLIYSNNKYYLYSFDHDNL